MYSKPQVRIGDVVGSLRIISSPMRVMKTTQVRTCVLCECICGKETVVNLYDLLHGHYQSCGCLKHQLIGKAKRTHGESYSERRTPEYHVWDAIRQRCYNPKDKGYKNYGGRGIRMAEEWNSYEKFIADVGRCPAKGMSIDRINNDGNYAPGNIKWATTGEQARNRRTNRNLTFRGETLCLVDWAKRTGIGFKTIWNRLDFGWSVEEALTIPVGQRRPKKVA